LPVAVGILGARRFADPRAETLALIGAGVQGLLNLEAYAREFPLKAVRIFSRSKDKTAALATLCRDMGLEAQICEDAQHAIRDADIVVSSISESFGIKPFLNIAWLKAGAYVSTVDLLRPWYCEPSDSHAFMVADDVSQARDLIAAGRVPDILPIRCGLGQALAEERSDFAEAPVVLLQPGCCAGIFGMVAAILARAGHT
jgi:ornithine cyclodeaminase/alanine dehydrogenase-like protein (mu-crystallin family)